MDVLVGYFTSGNLRELAEATLAFLRSDKEAKLRLITSPHLAPADLEVLRDALRTDSNFLPLLFPDFENTPDGFRSHCRTALFHLVSSGRLELRVALKHEGDLHYKAWLFECPQGGVAVSGSANATERGLSQNGEQLTLSRSWLNTDAEVTFLRIRQRFDLLWSGTNSNYTVFKLNDQTLDAIERNLSDPKSRPLSPDELRTEIEDLLEREGGGLEGALVPSLTIPDFLNYIDPPYAHQGQAVTAWRGNGYNGIFSIATGGGKTLTSLIGASLLNQEKKKLLTVIAVPTKPLLRQWEKDVRLFSVSPITMYKKQKATVKAELRDALRRLRFGASASEVVLVTHEALKGDMLDVLSRGSGSTPLLLIADEVHNLGSRGFIDGHPEFFDFKLGLSATHERQFDHEGTDFLVNFFSGVVYEYPLEKAIGECLVTYEYYPHRVFLTAEEEDEFTHLTHQIKKLAFAAELPDGDGNKEQWKRKCMARRRLVESAQNKVKKISAIFPRTSAEISKTLIFCTDKNPEQLEAVNSMLADRKLLYHQVTQEETSNPRLLEPVIGDFTSGLLQVLTSKRVLDEGFNVPSVETAYLLSSNTVLRQWTQRLGRVLRTSEKTGKTKAVIHDFVALPLDLGEEMDSDLKALVDSEYKRISFFSKLSSNGLEEGGSMELQAELLEVLRR